MSEDLDQSKNEGEVFVEPKTGTEVSKERTRESEIKANVELWKSLGIDVDEADILSKTESLPEKEGFDWILYIPKGIKNSELYNMIKDHTSIPRNYNMGISPRIHDIDEVTMPRDSSESSYAVACRYDDGPDEDSYDHKEEDRNAKSPLEWEKIGDQYVTLKERLVAELRWSKDWNKESHHHLDRGASTWFPGCRTESNWVPNIGFNFITTEGSYYRLSQVIGSAFNIGAENIYTTYPGYGVRRVITAETDESDGNQPHTSEVRE